MIPFYAVNNNNNIALNADLNEFSLVEKDVTRYLHAELLKLFKVQSPEINLINNTSLMGIANDFNLEYLNPINVKYLNTADILAPKNLLTYYLLNQLLNIDFVYSDIAMKHGKKKQLIFESKSFELDFHEKPLHQNNELLAMVRKFISKSEMLNIASSYSIRMNDGMLNKMATSLTYFKTIYKHELIENKILNKIFDANRIQLQLNFFETN